MNPPAITKNAHFSVLHKNEFEGPQLKTEEELRIYYFQFDYTHGRYETKTFLYFEIFFR